MFREEIDLFTPHQTIHGFSQKMKAQFHTCETSYVYPFQTISHTWHQWPEMIEHLSIQLPS